MDAAKLREPGLCQSPEVLYAIDVFTTIGEFVLTVNHPVVLFVTSVNQAIIRLESIREDFRPGAHMFFNYRQKRGRGAVFHNLSVNLSFSFYQPKHYMLAVGATSPLAPHPPGSEEAFINFYFTRVKGTIRLAKLRDALPNAFLNLCNRTAAYSRQRRDFSRFKIQSKQSDYLSKFLFRNSGTIYILVNHLRTITYVEFLSS